MGDGNRFQLHSGVQSDEIWTFVGEKQRRVRDKDLNYQGPFSLLYD